MRKLKRHLQENDMIYCLDPDIAGEGCFLTGQRYRISGLKKDKRDKLKYVEVVCEAGCPHSLYVKDISEYFKLPQIPIRSLPIWW